MLTLRAYHEGGQVNIEIADDGAGIDPARLGAKAVERGPASPPTQLARMSPADVLQLIFLPGFSTAAAVTNVSGRGVGMDVVKTNIEKIGGTIEVESAPGRGTTVPAADPADAGDHPGADRRVRRRPLRHPAGQPARAGRASTPRRPPTAVEDVDGAPVYRLRGELLPLVDLADVLGLDLRAARRPRRHRRAAADDRRFGLVVDRVINTEEIVVKPLGGQLKAIGLYAGATILGDGTRRADPRRPGAGPPGAAGRERSSARSTAGPPRPRAPPPASASGCCSPRIGGGRRVAIPLATVTRLEEVRTRAASSGSAAARSCSTAARSCRWCGSTGTWARYGETDREVLEVVVYADHGRSVAHRRRGDPRHRRRRGRRAAATSTTRACSARRSSATRSPSCSTSARPSSPPTRRSTPAPPALGARRRPPAGGLT